MKRAMLWLLIAMGAWAVTVPAASALLWAMRGTFVGDYGHLKARCSELSGIDITPEMEESAGHWSDVDPKLGQLDDCADLSESLARYHEACPGRAMGAGIVVFLAVLLIRFMMMGDGRELDWRDEAE